MLINVNDIIIMKKPHPCDAKAVRFLVLRTGADIKIKCENCGHEIMISRHKLMKGIKIPGNCKDLFENP